jgi:enoyl-[acyl-carrier protein] reductase I
LGSLFSASAYHSPNNSSGSAFSRIMSHNMQGRESRPPPASCPCHQASVERGMTAAAQLMAGKKGLVMGVANERSIAWAISKACHDAGAKLAFTFQGEALEKRVRPLAKSIGCEKMVYPCDVTDAASIDAAFAAVGKEWGELDFLVHAIAFSDKNQLKGKYLDTTPDNFALTMNVSCYSFTAVAQRAVPLMKNGGSLLTLTYYGAERVIPHYNVMGVAKAALEASVRYLAADLGEQKIRVNAISAGPIKTLAFAGINDGRYILKWNELNSPLKRNITQEEVGNAALYLLSDLGTGMTGEVMHVDGGYHVVGMIKTSSAKQIAELLGNFEGE